MTQQVKEVCAWCLKIITRMPDNYDPLKTKAVCSDECLEREQWFTVTHNSISMNVLTHLRFGKSQANVPRYKGSS